MGVLSITHPRGQNTEANYYALARFGLFTGNNELYVAILELLDGAEAQENLYRQVGRAFGAEVRDDVFRGIGMAPLGLPAPDKPRTLHPVLERLEQRLGRGVPAVAIRQPARPAGSVLLGERRRYQTSQDIDHYLRKKHRALSES